MKRGGKLIYKRAVGRKGKDGDDDDDEEYVAEEEEESYEFDSSNEESIDGIEARNCGSSAAAEEIPCAKLKSPRGNSSGRQRSRVSDYEELEEDDDNEDDEDFSPDDNDEEEDWEEDSLVSGDSYGSARRGALKRDGRKRKGKVSKSKAKRRSRKAVRKRRRAAAISDDDDDGDFVVKDRALISGRKKVMKKVRKRTVKSRSARKKRSLADSDSFDSDHLTSDDDLSVKVAADRLKNKKITNSGRRNKMAKVDSETSDSDFAISNDDFMDNDRGVVARQRKGSKNEMKMDVTSRKQVSVESECTDSDDQLSESEVRDLEIEKALNLQKAERDSVGNKGKEKEADDLGKQLCGICLSEEQKGTIQGILNCCSHYFCFACIMEWSKVESRCPLCKRRFFSITKSSKSDHELQMRRHVIRVQMRDQVYQPSEEELRVLLDPYETVVCIECHQGGDDSLMLLCDICDSSAHTYCVGLGREVPEGNWYCECCKHAGEGSLHSQVLDTQAASSSHMSHGSVEENGSKNLQSNTSFHRSISFQGQSSSQGFDLNLSPRNFMEENGVVSSQALGAGASTLSGRRAIQQRIRILLSNNRARQIYVGPNRTDTALHNEAVHSALEQNGESIHNSESPNSLYGVSTSEQPQENSRKFHHSGSNLVPYTSSEVKKFRHVEGAKKQVHSIVKRYLKKLPREIPLEDSAFKKITRKVTHTILAACGIQHCRRIVSSFLQPPDNCSHDLDGGPVNLVRGCCSSCFTDYVKNVVKMFPETL